ncbi:hypothetical protein CTAYLR_000669 [Chrysophaeum taylorii]|uniref:Large ribosomal subunit protein bL28m n=1 Tax=Chrysophaeum taylorii TaxID=2483200 RepID=A0AAD7XJB8_9STRA|nr:hypothetical protein CTAYLR_000669 [Chrysophaeum taylorii]
MLRVLVRFASNRAGRGLYHGRDVRFGNNVSHSQRKTRRKWRPNVQLKRLWSRTLGCWLRFNMTTHALKCIERKGGIDEYLLDTKESKINSIAGMNAKKMILAHRKLAAADISAAPAPPITPDSYDISRLVLPETTSKKDVEETATRGRARLKYLEETHRVSRDETRPFAQELGRASLQLHRSVEVGYQVDGSIVEAEKEEELDEREQRIAESISLEGENDDERNLTMDLDWDTTTWSIREIERASGTLITEIQKAPRTDAGKKRRDMATQMLIRLIHRHHEARAYCERELENIINRGMPCVAYGLDDAGLNLGPLVAALAPLADFPKHLLELNVVRRVVNLLLAVPNAAARLVQTRVRLSLVLDPKKRKPPPPAAIHEDEEQEWLATQRHNAKRRKWLARCLELGALLERWRAVERANTSFLLRRDAPLDDDEDHHHRESIIISRRELLESAIQSYLAILDTLCTSARVSESARAQTCAEGRGVAALVIVARGNASVVAVSALRVLLLLASVPGLSKHVLAANVAGLCVGLVDAAGGNALVVRRLALDVLQALALATMAACRKESVSESEACTLLVRPRWVAAVVLLLEERDEWLFAGSARFAHRCAGSCARALRIVLKEILARGARPVERLIQGGLATLAEGFNNPVAQPGFAALELLAQLASDPECRTLLENGGGLADMLRPLLLDATSTAFLRGVATLLLMARVGTSGPVVPGTLGDVCEPDLDSSRASSSSSTRLSKSINQAAELSETVRSTLVQIVMTPPEDLAFSSEVLWRLGGAPALVLFLCRPASPTFLYELPRADRYVHCIALHRLLKAASPLARAMFDADGPGLLRFAALGVQAGFVELADDRVVVVPEDRTIHLVATEAVLRALACVAAIPADDDKDKDKDKDSSSGKTSAALLEVGGSPRAAVARALLETSLLGEVAGLIARTPRPDPADADVVDAACGLLTAATPVPIPDRLWELDREPPVPDAESYAALEETAAPFRTTALDALASNVSPSAPPRVCSAACLALSRLGASPRGAVALVGAGVLRAMASLAPRQPVSQSQVDAVLKRVPVAAVLDHSSPLHLETCRLVRLPVAWFALAAALAVAPEACRAMLDARLVLRALERFAIKTDNPKVDAAARLEVAKLATNVARAARSHKLEHASGALHEMLLDFDAMSSKLVGMLPHYNAAFAISELCSANVAAAVPRFVDSHTIPALVPLLLEPATPEPVLRHVLVALRAILRFPSPGGGGGGLERRFFKFGPRLDKPHATAVVRRLRELGLLDYDTPKTPISELARALLAALQEAVAAKCRARGGADVFDMAEALNLDAARLAQPPATFLLLGPRAPSSSSSSSSSSSRKAAAAAADRLRRVDVRAHPGLASTRPPRPALPASRPLVVLPAALLAPKPSPSPQEEEEEEEDPPILVDPTFGEPVPRPVDKLQRPARFDFPRINDVPAVTFENIHEIVARRRALARRRR